MRNISTPTKKPNRAQRQLKCIVGIFESLIKSSTKGLSFDIIYDAGIADTSGYQKGEKLNGTLPFLFSCPSSGFVE